MNDQIRPKRLESQPLVECLEAEPAHGFEKDHPSQDRDVPDIPALAWRLAFSMAGGCVLEAGNRPDFFQFVPVSFQKPVNLLPANFLVESQVIQFSLANPI